MSGGLLKDRVAIVTGGARGIGKALVEDFVAQGAKVVIADNGTSAAGEGADPKPAQDLAKALGNNTLAFTESVASPSAAKALVDLAVNQFGALDIVVNNAAILRDALVFKQDPGDFQAVVQTNLLAPFFLINAASPVLRDQFKAGRAFGRILNIGSTAGLYGNHGQIAYGATKAALLALTRITAQEMVRSGVTSNLLVPFAYSRITDTIPDNIPAFAKYKKGALRISPKHVAVLATMLASDLGAKITGQVVAVRGREHWLFSQPRPAARIVRTDADWTPESLAAAYEKDFAPKFTDLTTDLEHFNAEPVI
ncbi:MAG: SDR family NAD(P)-dependent oxidoreductase [Alphaproteobacteria bacterium]